MKLKEKCAKLNTFIKEFKNRIDNGEQPKLCRKFEAMLVEKLKPSMGKQWDLARSGERAYTQFLVELGYDKALGFFWEESSVLMDYYDTWFDEVWYSYEAEKHAVGFDTWENIKYRLSDNLGL